MKPLAMTMRDIAQCVADKYGLTVAEIRGQDRYRYIVYPRQEAMWEMSRVTLPDGRQRYSLTQIGNFFGKDHTTVLWSVRRHDARVVSGCIKSVLSLPNVRAHERRAGL